MPRALGPVVFLLDFAEGEPGRKFELRTAITDPTGETAPYPPMFFERPAESKAAYTVPIVVSEFAVHVRRVGDYIVKFLSGGEPVWWFTLQFARDDDPAYQ